MNDDILLPNMKAETLCAIKTVYDAKTLESSWVQASC